MGLVKVKSNKTNSPFRYPGGKFYARKIILSRVPPHSLYCEPFAGGASIFFSKPSVTNTILNDADEELINTYVQIQNNVEQLIKLLTGIPAEKLLHNFYKNEYKPHNDIERAFRWYYLNRTSYSGIMKPENCYWGYGKKYSMQPQNWLPHLRTVSEKLQGVDILCTDFETLIDTIPDNYFLFIDPPYFNADQKKFYSVNFEHEDHIRLSACLKRNANRVKFLITYDNSEYIRRLYDWCTVQEEHEWNYTINRTDNQKTGQKLSDGYSSNRNKGREVFIMNYTMPIPTNIQPLLYQPHDMM